MQDPRNVETAENEFVANLQRVKIETEKLRGSRFIKEDDLRVPNPLRELVEPLSLS